ncbi:hypothetical protein BJ912DRAFT_438001 [Pholiota molesta]|nr:hypothetical protein BJ912DRAFT_438001 [Pholiota molesta]
MHRHPPIISPFHHLSIPRSFLPRLLSLLIIPVYFVPVISFSSLLFYCCRTTLHITQLLPTISLFSSVRSELHINLLFPNLLYLLPVYSDSRAAHTFSISLPQFKPSLDSLPFLFNFIHSFIPSFAQQKLTRSCIVHRFIRIILLAPPVIQHLRFAYYPIWRLLFMSLHQLLSPSTLSTLFYLHHKAPLICSVLVHPSHPFT